MVEKYADHAKQVTSEDKAAFTAIFAQADVPAVTVSDYVSLATAELISLTDSARVAV